MASAADLRGYEVHINAIRQALANGNAAVMIGAGFSRNAEGGDQLSTWSDLADKLSTALEPNEEARKFSTSNVTQLAEQYAKVFSTPALEELLKRMIPDGQVAPGILHEKLLSLPWSEIFTTNYDTLLERAASKIIEQAHFTISCREDIPQSKILGRRRIVKLHGSFPSQRPFIFTEEDYRTYPDKFAPFVNLVRQSLLENIFCLIGFSGDDPNFLHWLGWVRDMLDKHALPVYLFLDKPPSLGQQKLLEARGVTPILLPEPVNSKGNKFSDRYAELFRKLSIPIKPPEREWGKVQWPSSSRDYKSDPAERYIQLVNNLPALADERENYPGWLVAPEKVRTRLQNSIRSSQYSTGENWVISHLDNESPAVALAILELHYWQEDITLSPTNDEHGKLGIRVLTSTANLEISALSKETQIQLSHLSIKKQSDLKRCWNNLAIGVMKWARQGLLEAEFKSLQELINTNSPDDLLLKDLYSYEEILLQTYLGNRSEARKLLKAWQIGSLDSYMQIRKSSLSAELGDTELALTMCSEAIQKIRERLRMKPGNTLLISQEAWACFVAEHIQRGLSHSYWYTENTNNTANPTIDGLSERLQALEARGYSPRQELEAALYALDSEARSPSEAKYKFAGFDLGGSSKVKRFGATSEFQNKIRASFAWLELAERTGLMVRTGNVTFYANSFLQAAWWIRYADSTERVLSILFRVMSSDVMKPKDENLPPHRTGWLSRYQVATLSIETASKTCERFIKQLESAFGEQTTFNDTEAMRNFFSEIFSRLVLRVVDQSKVLDWANRIIQLHRSLSVHNSPDNWKSLATSLARCLEALPTSSQLDLLKEISLLPHTPQSNAHEHEARNWLRLFELIHWLDDTDDHLKSDNDWTADVRHLIKTLQSNSVVNHAYEKVLAWEWIMFLNILGGLAEADRFTVSKILWKDNLNWPLIPGFQPRATFKLPAPPGIDLEDNFKKWCLTKEITPFSSPSAMSITGKDERLSWGFPTDDTALISWIHSARRVAWSEEEILKSIQIINNWWQNEGEDITQSLPKHPELREALTSRLNFIDSFFAEILRSTIKKTAKPNSKIFNSIKKTTTKLSAPGRSLWRIRMYIALRNNDTPEIIECQSKLATELLQCDNAEIYYAYSAADWLIEHLSTQDHMPLSIIIDTLIAVISARRMPGLLRALDVLASNINRIGIEHLSASQLKLIEVGLELLFKELQYSGRPEGTDITDEALPLLRFRCAQLACALNKKLSSKNSVVQTWLESTKSDPLPELRLSRFYLTDSK